MLQKETFCSRPHDLERRYSKRNYKKAAVTIENMEYALRYGYKPTDRISIYPSPRSKEINKNNKIIYDF